MVFGLLYDSQGVQKNTSPTFNIFKLINCLLLIVGQGGGLTRLILTLQNEEYFHFPDKHDIQGMIYTALGTSEFADAHDDTGFKYFTYSDLFYDRCGRSTLIVSSPNPRFIEQILDWTEQQEFIQLGKDRYDIECARVFEPCLERKFISGSPIILYLDSKSGEYFSFKHHGDISFFLDRLKDNALKKYEFYTGTRVYLNEPLFDEVKLRREFAVPVKIHGAELVFIGTMWNSLVKEDIQKEEAFYRFLMETGLGEKNSLGFGFINPVRSRLQ